MFQKFQTMLLIASMLCTAVAANAQDTKLPAPDKKGGSSMMEALWQRKTDRTFSDKKLSEKELANLLWATCGINRPENGKRTNPTARNLQEICLYVFFPERVCLYDHKTHSLKTVATGDHRKLLATGQDFVLKAPVTLLTVVDMSKYTKRDEVALTMAAADAGIVSQNINLFCAAFGLNTVTRGSMDREAISKLLGLTADQMPVLNNPVGHSK